MSVVDIVVCKYQDGRPVRGCPTSWPPKGTGEPEAIPGDPQQEEQTDTISGKAVADYDQYVDYEAEGSSPDIKAVNEEEENSDAEYVKMELP